MGQGGIEVGPRWDRPTQVGPSQPIKVEGFDKVGPRWDEGGTVPPHVEARLEYNVKGYSRRPPPP